jgi:hypothetical protein
MCEVGFSSLKPMVIVHKRRAKLSYSKMHAARPTLETKIDNSPAALELAASQQNHI